MPNIVFNSETPNGKEANTATFSTRFRMPRMSTDKFMVNHCHSETPANEFAKIAALPGVAELSSYEDYKLYVKKSGAFTWDELRPQIEPLLQQAHTRLNAPNAPDHCEDVVK